MAAPWADLVLSVTANHAAIPGGGFCTDGNHKATIPVGRWVFICAVISGGD